MAGFLLGCQLSAFLRFFVSFNNRRFNFHRDSVIFFELATVVGIKQNLFQLGDQWVARVSTSTLVIKCVFRQFIYVSEEVSFLNACFTDRFRNTQFSFDAVQPCQQLLNLRSSTVARCAQTQVVSDFCITTTRLWAVILAECSLLGWVVVGVITDNVADQQGVRQTVRNVELRTQLVRH